MSNQKLITDIGGELIEDLFVAYFESKISPYTGIDTFDVTCTKDLNEKKVIVNVQIYGTAGSPTVDDFKLDRVKFQGVRSVTVERSDIGKFNFELKPSKTLIVNSNDYLISYECK